MTQYCCFLLTTNHLPLWIEAEDRRYYVVEIDHDGHAAGPRSKDFTGLVEVVLAALGSPDRLAYLYRALMTRELPEGFSAKTLNVERDATDVMKRIHQSAAQVTTEQLREHLAKKGVFAVSETSLAEVAQIQLRANANQLRHVMAELGWSRLDVKWGGVDYTRKLWVHPDYAVHRGNITGPDGKSVKGRINQVLKFQGLDRVQVTEAGPGDIVLINGIADIGIGVTVTDPNTPMPMPMLKVDEPTLTMNFCVNTSPLAGRDGKFVTSRQIWDRLQKELQHNVALRVKETDEDGIFEVAGRGELHLTILLENMRREGYELAVSKPRVLFKDVNGERHEPIELVTADIEEEHQGGVMQALGERKGELVNMEPDGRGRVRLEYRIPARGLIGFTNEFLNLTRGSGLISNIFDSYEPHKGDIAGRKNGVLISMDDGEIFTYALGKLDDRGRMFVKAGDPVYEGMIVGIHSRDNDLVVNATRTKQLTNFRVSGKEDAVKITPPIDLTLEYGVEFIEDDELVEITPKSVRLRKRFLKEHERKRNK